MSLDPSLTGECCCGVKKVDSHHCYEYMGNIPFSNVCTSEMLNF